MRNHRELAAFQEVYDMWRMQMIRATGHTIARVTVSDYIVALTQLG